MGGLAKLIPFTYVFIMIGSLSLMGFPFLTGFYSKDLILELAFSTFSPVGHFAFWMGSLAAFFTALYSFRIIYYVFLGPINGNRVIYSNIHDAPILIAIPLIILGFASIFAGYVGKDLFVGLGTDFWANSIYCSPLNTTSVDAEFLPVYFKLIPVILSIIGLSSAYIFQTYIMFELKTKNSVFIVLFNFLNRKWLFDRIYNEWISQKGLWFGYVISYKTLDKGVLEYFGPAGLTHLARNLAAFSSNLQTGLIFSYAFLVLLSVLFLASITLFYYAGIAVIEIFCVAMCAFFIHLFLTNR
jgi:NADH-ubiquinone oxidoreductase chain 5